MLEKVLPLLSPLVGWLALKFRLIHRPYLGFLPLAAINLNASCPNTAGIQNKFPGSKIPKLISRYPSGKGTPRPAITNLLLGLLV
jgi:hypothetical protein